MPQGTGQKSKWQGENKGRTNLRAPAEPSQPGWTRFCQGSPVHLVRWSLTLDGQSVAFVGRLSDDQTLITLMILIAYWQTQLGNLSDQLDLSWVQNICWIFSKKKISSKQRYIRSPTIHKIRKAAFDCFPNRMINSRDRVQSCDDLDRSAAHGWLRCIGEGWQAKQYRLKDVWPSIMWIGGRQHRGRQGQPGGEDRGGRWHYDATLQM